MIRHWKWVVTSALAVTTTGFSFIPGDAFTKFHLWDWSPEYEYWNDTINKISFLLVIGLVLYLAAWIWEHCRTQITLKSNEYKIIIEHGDIFEMDNCKKVINFDECFTTEIGEAPYQIKPESVCGKFLQKFGPIDITSLISRSGLKPIRRHSEFNNQQCYKLGSIVPYNDFYLMAFSKLNNHGRAEMSRDEYLECLQNLWTEIEKYFSQNDVAITILGSGITKLKDETLSRQKLVDIIIASYKLSSHKLKPPYALHIVCNKTDGFSLNKVGKNFIMK